MIIAGWRNPRKSTARSGGKAVSERRKKYDKERKLGSNSNRLLVGAHFVCVKI